MKENSVVTFTNQEQLLEWSRTYVGAATDVRLIDGYQNGSFGPLNALIRAEACCNSLTAPFGYFGQCMGNPAPMATSKQESRKRAAS
ncbi:S-layer homology domain-containing protein [Paenibacillus chitinolyticus]|uniref:S-layer homology domain-containing protein n=1 Tax=Paenibacillus chitinolyticus TaxID=79263 RepID=UPI0036D91A13